MLYAIDVRELLFLFLMMPLLGVVRGFTLRKGARWVLASACAASAAGAGLVLGVPRIHWWVMPWLDVRCPFWGDFYVACSGLCLVFAMDAAICVLIKVPQERWRGHRWRAALLVLASCAATYVIGLSLFVGQIDLGWLRVVRVDVPSAVDAALGETTLYAIRADECLRRGLSDDAGWGVVQRIEPTPDGARDALVVLECPTWSLLACPLVTSSFDDPCTGCEPIVTGEAEVFGIDVTELFFPYVPTVVALCERESLDKWSVTWGTGSDMSELHLLHADAGAKSLGMRLPFVNRRWSDQEGIYTRWAIRSNTVVNGRTLFLEIGRRMGVFYRVDTDAAWVVRDIVSGAVAVRGDGA